MIKRAEGQDSGELATAHGDAGRNSLCATQIVAGPTWRAGMRKTAEPAGQATGSAA